MRFATLPVLLAAVALAALASCSSAPTGDAREAERARRELDEQDLDPGTFAWVRVDGRKDRLEEALRIRDAAVKLIVELAVTAEGQGAVLDARDATLATFAQRLRAIAAEAKAALDEQRSPDELVATFAWGDLDATGDLPGGRSGRRPAGESATFHLTRRAAEPRRLTVTGIDIARGGRVDRTVDALSVAWGAVGAPPRLEARVEVGPDRAPVAYVTFDGEAPQRLESPRLSRALPGADANFYRPLAELHGRSLALGTLSMRPRRAGAPAGTSFAQAAAPAEPKR